MTNTTEKQKKDQQEHQPQQQSEQRVPPTTILGTYTALQRAALEADLSGPSLLSRGNGNEKKTRALHYERDLSEKLKEPRDAYAAADDAFSQSLYERMPGLDIGIVVSQAYGHDAHSSTFNNLFERAHAAAFALESSKKDDVSPEGLQSLYAAVGTAYARAVDDATKSGDTHTASYLEKLATHYFEKAGLKIPEQKTPANPQDAAPKKGNPDKT